MQIYVALVLDGRVAAKEYGVSDKALYVMAPSGKLFRGFTQKILEVISFGGVRFFNIDADLKGICEVPAELLKAAINGDETLAAVQKKLAAYINGFKATTAKSGGENKPDAASANGDTVPASGAPADTKKTPGK